MPMMIDELVKAPAAWMSRRGAGVVISSRVRLARNLKDAAFPGWAGEDECVRLCGNLKQAMARLESLQHPLFLDMDKLGDTDRAVLRERNLISAELAEKGRGSALVVAGDQHVAVMVNEEDHIRLQAVRPGLHLRSVWNRVNAIDTELEEQVGFAFSRELGYLTACPSNVGTGLRASVMMHLSGLKLTGEVDAVLNGLGKLGLAVRGLFGEGTEAYGNMFQISNQSTLGESETEIIARLTAIVKEVAQHEENARARLMESRQTYVLDQVARAYAVLTHAHVLNSGEAIDLLSGLRLGVELGIVKQLSIAAINETVLFTQPGHLQRLAGKTLSPDERDMYRAELVKSRLQQVGFEG